MEAIVKIWRKSTDKTDVEKLYHNRFNGETTIRTGLTIHPMKQKRSFELYYVPTESMLRKLEQINHNDRVLTRMEQSLPGVAQNEFLLNIISEELHSSNEIEGVKSNKREIAESTKRIAEGKGSSNIRMHSMIHSYLKLRENTLKLPDKPQDIRTIYDFITQGEIDEKNLPDGEIFIAEGADIMGNSYGKVIHHGVYGEKEIIKHIEWLLGFLREPQMPFLVKLAVAHYYFGYIHPFYDGNGRTNRFITSLYLSKEFSLYTAYAFSNGCRIKHKKYLDLFDCTNKFNSYGELNYAIESFLDILISGQNFIYEALDENLELLKLSMNAIEADIWLKENKVAYNIVLLFCQVFFFEDRSLSRNDAISIIKKSNSKWSCQELKATMALLEEKGYLVKTKGKPIEYMLNESFLE